MTEASTVLAPLSLPKVIRRCFQESAYPCFFSTARWQVDRIGLTVFDLVLTHLVADGADLHLAVDDTAHRRRGKKVHGVGWIHDGSAPARNKLAFGHRWVIVGVIVRPSFLSRPLCLPVLCRRWRGRGTASTVDLAAQMITTIAERVPGRRVHVVADAAYHGKGLRDLPAQISCVNDGRKVTP